MSEFNDLEKLIILNRPVGCPNCGGKLVYKYSGIYECEQCGCETLDDLGKVKKFIEENGPTPAVVISRVTGVKSEIITTFLKQGRIEIPDGSKYYLTCEQCGCSIRYGRYCPSCVKSITSVNNMIPYSQMGEKPKKEPTVMAGKMHFLNRRK